MNKEDVIRMAINSHLVMADYDNPSLEAFAALVAAAEREACAKLCDGYEEWCGPWGQDDNQYAATESAMEIAKAIRARNNND